MIDVGRFHVYSATLTEHAGRWTVSLTGVAAELHQAERSRSTRHAVPVGVDRGELFRQILYKAKWHGIEVRVADRFFPSSKTCSGCGHVKKEMDLSQRTYSCRSCELTISRDLNAAINLARWSSKVSTPIAPIAPASDLLLTTA